MPGLSLRPIHARRAHRAACALAAAVVTSTGCATAINGRTQRVAVASDPPGARVFLGGEAVGVTPTWVELDRRRDRHAALRFEKDCYREAVVEVPGRTSKWVIGNALFAGYPVNEYGWRAWLGTMSWTAAVGGFYDWRSGGAFKFPNLVRARLDPRPDAPGAPERGAAGTCEGVEPDGGGAPRRPASGGAPASEG